MEEKPKARKISLGNAIIAGFIALIIGFTIGSTWSNYSPYLGFKSSSSNDWSALNEVYDTLASKYDGEVNFETALEGAKKGIAASVEDVYTVYMSASEATDFNKSLHGDVGSGIGVVIAKRDGYIRIVRTLPDNPASKAGILAGDIVYKIDDENVLNLDSDEIATKLRGADGTKVKLTIVRDGEEKSINLTMLLGLTPTPAHSSKALSKSSLKRESTKLSSTSATTVVAMFPPPKTCSASGLIVKPSSSKNPPSSPTRLPTPPTAKPNSPT